MPENLGGWQARVWAMGSGTRVGQATAKVVTRKNIMMRLQAPRFFVQKDVVVLSGVIHNYLKTEKKVQAVLELDGESLVLTHDHNGPVRRARTVDGTCVTLTKQSKPMQVVTIPAGGEARVDWWVAVAQEGEAVVRMKALTDEESDAMEMRFPVYVHGAETMKPQCGVIRPQDKNAATINYVIPKERRIESTRLEIRYSPTLAMAMVDALPYLAEFPYGCTEQTLNRFVPTVITQNVLQRMGVKLEDLATKVSNLNAQEIGDDKARAEQWKKRDWRYTEDGKWVPRNPIYDSKLLARMVKKGVSRLSAMQCGDGGWGWFSGAGERSSAHTTATVVRGLLLAQENGVAITPGVLKNGVAWLQRYEKGQVRLLKNGELPAKEREDVNWKSQAGELDALVYATLAQAGQEDISMRDYLFRDRLKISVYGLALYGLGLRDNMERLDGNPLIRKKIVIIDKLKTVLENLKQYIVEDDENQTAYLNLGNQRYWWYWYGSEWEAHAIVLKLLSKAEPKSRVPSRLVKYLLNNRKHATYWNSTRDTALCLEAFADYIKAAGEDKPDMTVEIKVDGKLLREVQINKDNLFSYPNSLVLEGKALTSGKHTITVNRKGSGPLYWNAYLSYFSLEDYIPKAGLEVKVERKFYRLKKVDKQEAVSGAHGQAVQQKVEKYEREPLADLALLKSGELVEVEMVVDSKNDYEYIILEDMKAAGFEPVEVRSGYNGNELGAYVEFRDERVVFFVQRLARGKHSVSYRLRAEIPGRFSALPTQVRAMYAPELRANSAELKLNIRD
jgi:uncharacterized protein YfaS (alpha-2-macroglobulin family)